jgi:hypothetical protein
MLDECDNKCFVDERCTALFVAMFDDRRWREDDEDLGWKAVCRETRDKIMALGYSREDATEFIQEELDHCE